MGNSYKDIEYWIWLQRALGVAARADDILSFFASPREFYEAGRREWVLSGVVSSDTADKLSNANVSESYSVIEECEKNNWTIISPDSEHYPERLRTIPSYPLALYVWGDAAVLSSGLMLSFVGTREASRYGLSVAGRFAYELALAGAVVVSGGALGIDSASHRGAIAAGGKTVAFLGCGLGYDYLRENRDLRREISGSGAVVSEFPPHTPPARGSFPVRNRLISGVSLGTVVIEAGVKSGSLITAGHALRQGRDVFAVPGDIISSNFTGANKLIKDGAKPVFSSSDILEEYVYLFPGLLEKTVETASSRVADIKIEKEYHKSNEKANIYKRKEKFTPFVKKAPDDGMGVCARSVYACLADAPMTIDDIAEGCGLPVMDVLAALTELEMTGYAVQHEGKLFSAKSE